MNATESNLSLRRHPGGLAIVIGLHVLLAAGLVHELGRREVTPRIVEPPVTWIAPDVEKEPPPVDKLPPPTQKAMPKQQLDPIAPRPHDTPDLDRLPNNRVLDGAPEGTDALPVDPGPSSVPGPAVVARAALIDATAASCRPEYPASAQRAGATGLSKIRFTVDAAGRVTAAQVLQASGITRDHRLLDRAAAEALQRCPIQAGVDANGQPVGTTVDVEYLWKIE